MISSQVVYVPVFEAAAFTATTDMRNEARDRITLQACLYAVTSLCDATHPHLAEELNREHNRDQHKWTETYKPYPIPGVLKYFTSETPMNPVRTLRNRFAHRPGDIEEERKLGRAYQQLIGAPYIREENAVGWGELQIAILERFVQALEGLIHVIEQGASNSPPGKKEAAGKPARTATPVPPPAQGMTLLD